MKALLIFPRRYSIAESVKETLEYGGAGVNLLDYRSALDSLDAGINSQMFRFPDRIRRGWESYFYRKINGWYLEQFRNLSPDLVFIYNNELILPSTLEWLRSNHVRIAFYLGDNPLYSQTSRHNMALLEYADAIFVPDSFWKTQLQKTGLENIHHYMIAIPDKSYHPTACDSLSETVDNPDILYVGISYHDSWGYKKAKYLNSFSGMNFRLYGNKTWKRWFCYFPTLEKHFIETNTPIPVETLNRMYNRSKLLPVDGNPGLMHGLHIRIVEALGAGILPLSEWQQDLQAVFGELAEAFTLKDYRIAREKAGAVLSDDPERIRLIADLRYVYESKFNHNTNAGQIFQALRMNRV